MREVLNLLVNQIRSVMALGDTDVPPGVGGQDGDWREVRFDEDLHVDSLDLVEVIEGVERALRGRGVQVALPDAELVGLRRVGDAADRILARAAGGLPEPLQA